MNKALTVDNASRCIFIDETGLEVGLCRDYGWALKGEECIVETPTYKSDGLKVSVMGAIHKDYGMMHYEARVAYPKRQLTEKQRRVRSNLLASMTKEEKLRF